MAVMKPQKFSISDILTRSPTIVKHDRSTKKTDIKSDGEDEGHEIHALPTPPRSPETDVNSDHSHDGIREKSPRDSACTSSGKRKRDPIGQILDSLGSETNKKQNTDKSAFSPIITSSSSSQLSPLNALAQCDTRRFQMSPEAMCSPYQLSGHCDNDRISPAHASIEQLQFIQAQKLAFQQQQQLHHQQQQQAALNASLYPYMLQSGMARNLQQLHVLRSQQDQMLALENYNIALANSTISTNPQPPSTSSAAAAPFWMAWLKSPAANAVTSFPVKETRIPPPPRYQCDACKKSYSTFGGLSKHKQFHCVSHVKKEFNCKYCEKSYGSLGALKMHIRTHTLPCKCKLCGKAFSRPWLLQGHVRTHTGEKPFKCAHCGRAFADRSNLRAHLQTHSDIKKYGCKNCTKTFSRMSLLLKHEEGSCLGIRR